MNDESVSRLKSESGKLESIVAKERADPGESIESQERAVASDNTDEPEQSRLTR